MIEADIHPHVPSERADLFTVSDAAATENEYLELLRALIRVSKPGSVLETGSYTGDGTVAIAAALHANGFGHVYSLEYEIGYADRAKKRLDGAVYQSYATVLAVSSLTYLLETTRRFDFAFLDSDLATRANELGILLSRNLLTPGAIVAIHDTSRARTHPSGGPCPELAEFLKRIRPVVDGRRLQVVDFPLSRGMTVIRVLP